MSEAFDLPTAALVNVVAEVPPAEWPYALVDAGIQPHRVDDWREYLYLLDDVVRGVDVDGIHAEAVIAASGRSMEAFGEDCDELSNRITREQFEFRRQEARL